jgi:hypothetical protein
MAETKDENKVTVTAVIDGGNLQRAIDLGRIVDKLMLISAIMGYSTLTLFWIYPTRLMLITCTILLVIYSLCLGISTGLSYIQKIIGNQLLKKEA